MLSYYRRLFCTDKADVILIFLYPNDVLFWLYNVHKIGKRPAKGLLTVALTIFLFSLALSMYFFLKEVHSVLSTFI